MTYKDPLWRFDLILILIAIAGICIVMFSGCMSVDKAKTFLKDKGKLAEICADTYPVKDTTIYIAGDTITDISFYHDTLYQPLTDTIYHEGIEVVKYRPCPPTKVITKRITDTLVKQVENTARVEALRNDLAALKTKYDIVVGERDKARKQAKNRFWWILILVGAGGGYLFLKLKRIIR